MILQLDPPIPLQTPKGPGIAVIFRDRGIDFEDEWTVFLDNQEIWNFRNSQVRAVENYTFARMKPDDSG